MIFCSFSSRKVWHSAVVPSYDSLYLKFYINVQSSFHLQKMPRVTKCERKIVIACFAEIYDVTTDDNDKVNNIPAR